MTKYVKWVLLLPACWLLIAGANNATNEDYGRAVFNLIAAVGWVIIAANWRTLADWWMSRP